MFAPLRFFEGDREMLKKVAENIVDSYAIASEDPVIEMALRGMRERTEEELTADDYETVIKSFIRFVPAFRDSNIRMLGQLIQSMHREAEVFGFANDPEIITFFQQLDIVVAGAIRPDEFMAITDMLNDFEPTITNRVVELAPIEVLHQFTMNVINGVNTAREQGLSFGADADKRLEHAVTELNRGMLEREDYGNILRGIRSLHVEIIITTKQVFTMIRNILSLVGLFIATSLIVVGKDIRRPIITIAGVLLAIATVLYWFQ